MGSGSDEVEQLRQEADWQREDLGQTVGALAYKADVKNRGKEALEDKKEALMEKVDDLKTKVPGVGGGEGPQEHVVLGGMMRRKGHAGGGVPEDRQPLESRRVRLHPERHLALARLVVLRSARAPRRRAGGRPVRVDWGRAWP